MAVKKAAVTAAAATARLRILRAAAVLGFALTLGSCNVLQFIFGSIFPSTVTLIHSRTDLSAQITSQDGDSYNLRVVESQGFGYVVLTWNTAGLPVYIFDLNLNLRKTLTGLTTAGVLVDGSTGDIVIGDQAMNPSDLSPAATQPPSALAVYSEASAGSDGFYNAPGVWNVANLNIPTGGSSLGFATFTPSSWATAGSSPGVTLSAVQNNVALSAVLDDGNTADSIIVAVTLLNGATNPTTYFVSMPRGDFNASTPSGALLMDSSPHRDGLLTNTIGYAGGALVAWDSVSQSYVRMDPATLATTASLYTPGEKNSIQNLRFAYRAGGGSFYTYDSQTRVVTGYSAWW